MRASLASFLPCYIAEESPAALNNGAPSVKQAQRLSTAHPVAVRRRVGHCEGCSVPDDHTFTPWYETITTLPKMIACDILSSVLSLSTLPEAPLATTQGNEEKIEGKEDVRDTIGVHRYQS